MKTIGYLLSGLAFIIFLYSLFSANPIFQEKSIYWFLISFVSAIVPHLKSFKFKDFEFSLQERIEKFEEKIDHSLDEVKSSLENTLEMIKAKESNLGEAYVESRGEVYQDFNLKIMDLPPDERIKKQEFFTRKHLQNYQLTLAQLKTELKKQGFYQGVINDTFDQETVESFIKFQQHHQLKPVDGIFGSISLTKL